MRNFSKLTIAVVCGILSTAVASGETSKQGFSYPELLVVPKASERLKKEAQLENRNSWTRHIPVQVSALVTLGAGMMAMQDKNHNKDERETAKGAGQLATMVGGGWLGATVLASALYRPYRSCLKTVRPSSPKNRKDQLVRERAAEECIDAPASLGRKASWLSFLTNLAAGVYVASTADEDLTKAVGGTAALAAFAPMMFSYHWEDVKSYHQDYKKRIYGPIVQSGVSYRMHLGKLSPAVTAGILF